MAKSLYLVDGTSQLFRAFYAIPGLTNKEGIPTNAVLGFTTMLRKLIKDESPEYLAVALQGRNMAALSRMPLTGLGAWLDRIRVPARERTLAEPALAKAKVRVDLLGRLGLGYLHLFRTTASLSAGEAQRLQLARTWPAACRG